VRVPDKAEEQLQLPLSLKERIADMIFASKEPDAPSELWNFDDENGDVWVGKRRLSYGSVPGRPDLVTVSRVELQEAAKSHWRMGFNAKANEVRKLLGAVARRFDAMENLLPNEVVLEAKPPGYRMGLVVVAALFAILIGGPMGIVLVDTLVKGFRAEFAEEAK
jgi:hypothetical protein